MKLFKFSFVVVVIAAVVVLNLFFLDYFVISSSSSSSSPPPPPPPPSPFALLLPLPLSLFHFPCLIPSVFCCLGGGGWGCGRGRGVFLSTSPFYSFTLSRFVHNYEQIRKFRWLEPKSLWKNYRVARVSSSHSSTVLRPEPITR